MVLVGIIIFIYLLVVPPPGSLTVTYELRPPTGIPDEKVCPRCAETVEAAALVCRFCGHEFGSGFGGPNTSGRVPDLDHLGDPVGAVGASCRMGLRKTRQRARRKCWRAVRNRRPRYRFGVGPNAHRSYASAHASNQLN